MTIVELGSLPFERYNSDRLNIKHIYHIVTIITFEKCNGF